MRLSQGERLGRYVIDGVIGHGAMGTVYRAHDTRLQRRVALKVVGDDARSRLAMEATGGPPRILREARIAAKLEHPNVVVIYDADEIQSGAYVGVAWLAMELVEGHSLRTYAADRSIPITTRVRWLTEAARGLAAAHDRGLVHRDVKPENIMVRDDGVTKVLDFGVARELSRPEWAAVGPRSPSAGEPTLELDGGVDAHAAAATGKETVFGTPYYMSPEQMRGEPIDAKSDQFSWGVVAYEVLAGVGPWGKDQTPIRIVAAVLETEVEGGELREAGAPEWLVQVVLQAMNKKVCGRFASMVEVVEALDAEGGGDAGGALRVPGLSERVRASKAFWLFSAALVMLLVTTGVAVSRFVRSRGRNGASPSPSAPASTRPNKLDACVSNTTCTRSLGRPAVCVAGACAALASPDCHVLADQKALADDSTLWIGSMLPLTGIAAADGAMNELAFDLARQDFAEAANTLNASGGPVRPIGVVSCDSTTDSSRVARHLVEDLHLPAILGFPDGNDLIRLASTLFIPHHVLALTTLTPNPLITAVPRPDGEPPLVWRTSFSMSECAHAVAAATEGVLEPQLRKEGAAVTRVTLLRRKTPGHRAASEKVFAALRFNGRSALENGDRFQEIVFDQTADSESEASAALSKIRAFGPNIVIYSDGFLVKPVIEPFERVVANTRGARPRFITMIALEGPILETIGDDADLRHRNFGFTLPSTTGVNARFTLHFNGAYGKKQSRADAPSTSYDGFYLLAYAAMWVGERPITGLGLAEAFARLVPPGFPIEVGPAGISEAFTKLKSGVSIDLVGAASALDLDTSTGDNATDLSLLCAEIDKRGRAIGATESGLIYSAKTGRLEGTMSCP